MPESHFRSHWELVGGARGGSGSVLSSRPSTALSGRVGLRLHLPVDSADTRATGVRGGSHGRGEKRAARPRKNGVRATALQSCVSFHAFEGTDREESTESGKKKRLHICCPETFFCDEVSAKIQLNREHERQRWIFDLIGGRISARETVFLDDPSWLLVEGTSYSGQLTRYLVIFKDLELHTIRDLRQRHVPMLLGVQQKVREFLAMRHGPNEAFRLYFHYLPSVFQLHLHVCSGEPLDSYRRQYLAGVIRNIKRVDTWYRDALMLFASSRATRETRECSPERGVALAARVFSYSPDGVSCKTLADVE